MQKKVIVNIGRQYGSGGRQIGKKVAERYGIPYYDKEIIEHIIKESGISRDLFDEVEKQQTTSFLYSIAREFYSPGSKVTASGTVSMIDRLYVVQNDVIKKIAKEGPCVIVGRCANYILKDFHCVNVFIYADLDYKVRVVAERENLSEGKAKNLITKIDKKRASYYNYYVSEKWGSFKYNDMLLDSSVIGIDGCVEMIDRLISLKYGN